VAPAMVPGLRMTPVMRGQKIRMSDFVHLHTHNYYGLLDGMSSPEELVIAAKKAGYSRTLDSVKGLK